MKVYIFSHFEPSGLRCELIVMPLGRVSGRDNLPMKVFCDNKASIEIPIIISYMAGQNM